VANAYKRLAALRPADTSEAELYASPASTETICKLFVCNQDTSNRTFSVAFTDASGAATGEDWLYSGFNLPANFTHEISGISLAAAETIRVQASVADKISFVLTGLQIS
jgi:hypothetical protein